MGSNYDFGGWATKNDLKCSDGRTIRANAFKDQDGAKVPLVWNHQHNDAHNVLGHAMLENRADGVYAYCTFNDTESGRDAKELVRHGDINSLSIYANKLKHNGADVIHGAIREVSLVLAGANPGASICEVFAHSEDGVDYVVEDECVLYTGENSIELSHNDEDNDSEEDLSHADNNEKKKEDSTVEEQKNQSSGDDKTIGEVFDTLTEEQKNAVYALVGAIKEEDNNNEGDSDNMKHSVFAQEENDAVLSHSDVQEIFEDAKNYGSLKKSFLQHADVTPGEDYGIGNIDYLYPDYQNVNKEPEFIKRNNDWVAKVMNGTHKSPFSRIRSLAANITESDARAKGYIKGNQKTEEVFPLLKRETTPQTIYKKQMLDRDDIVDITSFDVVAWLKKEMRMMLEEEIARAILIGDGRVAGSADSISKDHIRPIWGDASTYTINQTVTVANNATDEAKAKAFMKACVKARKNYKGSGNPVLFTTEDLLTDMLLIEDTTGRTIYDTVDKLKNYLRVSDIVTVPVMEDQTRTASGVTYTLGGIIVNLEDYNVGADKGGAVNMFDDFDIDFNQQKYLIETRCSGALIKPYSAISVEFVPAGE